MARLQAKTIFDPTAVNKITKEITLELRKNKFAQYNKILLFYVLQ